MEITPLQRKVVASDIAPEQLAGNAQLSQREKIGEASRQFEALLLRQILESTQKTVIKSKFSDNSTSADIYRGQITTQLADSISKSGTFGLAKAFEHQLNRPSDTALATKTNSPAHASSLKTSPRRSAECKVRSAELPESELRTPNSAFRIPHSTHPTFKTP